MKYTKKFKEDIVTRYSKGKLVPIYLYRSESVLAQYNSWIKNSVGIVLVVGFHMTIQELENKISRLEKRYIG